jgi:hypothetical protein
VALARLRGDGPRGDRAEALQRYPLGDRAQPVEDQAAGRGAVAEQARRGDQAVAQADAVQFDHGDHSRRRSAGGAVARLTGRGAPRGRLRANCSMIWLALRRTTAWPNSLSLPGSGGDRPDGRDRRQRAERGRRARAPMPRPVPTRCSWRRPRAWRRSRSCRTGCRRRWWPTSSQDGSSTPDPWWPPPPADRPLRRARPEPSRAALARPPCMQRYSQGAGRSYRQG